MKIRLVTLLVFVNLLFLLIGIFTVGGVIRYLDVITPLPFILKFILFSGTFRGLFYIFDSIKTLVYLFGDNDESDSDNE